MNIAFFLTPKHDVITLDKTMTLAEAMDVMQKHRYTSVPVLDSKGRYAFTLSEGDLLWYIRQKKDKPMAVMDNLRISKIKRHHNIQAVSIESNIDSLVELASMQAFVPVVDDSKTFIGIIKRSDIIHYLMTKMTNKEIAYLA